MTKKQKKMVFRLTISGMFFISAVVMENTGLWAGFPYILAYLFAGYDIPWKALRNIKNGQVFDENFLMTIATFGAIAVGSLEEAVAVMLFYQVGELFNDYAVNQSRKSIQELMDINPEYANLLRDGVEEQVDPYEVNVGDTIIIRPGEKVPLDGVVLRGNSSLDVKALTGEPMPAEVEAGSSVVSGSINLNGVLKVQTTRLFDDSTVAKILELVENASSRKAKAETFITKFARYYTPIVVIAALLIAVLPPLVLGQGFSDWIQRGCIFLVISCPCALVISVPLSFFGGIGAASSRGILVKGSNYLEMVSRMDTIVFDKTGTLTKGEFEVSEVVTEEGKDALRMAASIEKYSGHPIARSILNACQEDLVDVSGVEEIPGYGMKGMAEGKVVLAGNQKLLLEHGVMVPESTERLIKKHQTSTTVYVSVDGIYAGCIFISDQIKPGVKEALSDLKRAGVRRFVMLTGDKKETGEAIAGQLGIGEVHAELLPEDKVTELEKIMERCSEGKYVAFAGDGINDAPVITRADIGIAMGSMGSDAAIEAADVVLMEDDISRLASIIRISVKTMKIVRQNIVFALGVKFLVLILGALGQANMWEAVFADVGVAVIAILNAMRANSAR